MLTNDGSSVFAVASGLIYLFAIEALYGLFIDYSILVFGLRVVAVVNMARIYQIAQLGRAKGRYLQRLELWNWGKTDEKTKTRTPSPSRGGGTVSANTSAPTSPQPRPATTAVARRLQVLEVNINGAWALGGPRSENDPKVGSVAWMNSCVKSSRARVTSVMLFVFVLHVFYVYSDRGAYATLFAAESSPTDVPEYVISVPQFLFNSNNEATTKFMSFTALAQPATAYVIILHELFALFVYWGFLLTLEASQMGDLRSKNGFLHFQAHPPTRGVL